MNLPALAEGRFDAHLERRIAGEPVARILGEKEFWGLPFEVNAATLVPRPDTETLVEAVLDGSAIAVLPADITICDLGTGSRRDRDRAFERIAEAHAPSRPTFRRRRSAMAQEKCRKARRCRAN